MWSLAYTRYAAAIRNTVQASLRQFCDWLRKPRWLPLDVVGSRLVFAEKSFSIRHPINLVARVDRAYLNGSDLVLLELKTRSVNRIFESDIIELSAQRLAVQLGSRYRVHDYGFVVLLNPETHAKAAHKVALHPEEEVIAIASRRRSILGGGVEPRGPAKAACCGRCEYRAECNASMLP